MVDVRASNAKLRARSRRIVALATGAPDDEIEAALTATGGEVKNVILVILGGLDATTAATLLAEHDGQLRTALRSARALCTRRPVGLFHTPTSDSWDCSDVKA